MKFVFYSDIKDHNNLTEHKLTEKKVMFTMVPSAETLA